MRSASSPAVASGTDAGPRLEVAEQLAAAAAVAGELPFEVVHLGEENLCWSASRPAIPGSSEAIADRPIARSAPRRSSKIRRREILELALELLDLSFPWAPSRVARSSSRDFIRPRAGDLDLLSPDLDCPPQVRRAAGPLR